MENILNEQELEKATAGYGIKKRYSFDVGDCFRYLDCICRVTKKYTDVGELTEIKNHRKFDNGREDDFSYQAQFYENYMKYLGKDVI